MCASVKINQARSHFQGPKSDLCNSPGMIGRERMAESMVRRGISLAAGRLRLDCSAAAVAAVLLGRSHYEDSVETTTKSVLGAAAAAVAGNSSNFDSLEFVKKKFCYSHFSTFDILRSMQLHGARHVSTLAMIKICLSACNLAA